MRAACCACRQSSASVDEELGQTVAAKLIDRAHEIANLPECECDVDVSVEWIRPDGSADPGDAPAGGRLAER